MQGTPIANRYMQMSGTELLTLWGSNGYNSGANDFSGSRGTGFDLRAALVCGPAPTEPPIIVDCPECPSGQHSIAYSSVQSGVAIERSAVSRLNKVLRACVVSNPDIVLVQCLRILSLVGSPIDAWSCRSPPSRLKRFTAIAERSLFATARTPALDYTQE